MVLTRLDSPGHIEEIEWDDRAEGRLTGFAEVEACAPENIEGSNLDSS